MAKQPGRTILSRSPSEARGRGLIQGIRDIINELRKVVWPSRQQATRLSIFVVIIALVIGAFLGLIDLGFTQIFNRFVIR